MEASMDFDIDREKIIMEKDNQNIECDILFRRYN